VNSPGAYRVSRPGPAPQFHLISSRSRSFNLNGSPIILARIGLKLCHSLVSKSRSPSYCASFAAVTVENCRAVMFDCTKRKIATAIIPRIVTANMISSKVKPPW
jgi:hypothetical protein